MRLPGDHIDNPAGGVPPHVMAMEGGTRRPPSSTGAHGAAAGALDQWDGLPVLLRVRDVARVLGLSARSAYRHVRAGACGTYTELGGAIRIRRDVFLRAMEGTKSGSRRRKPLDKAIR